MNGLFKAWVAAALPLILNAEIVRCPAAAIQVIAEDTPSIAAPIAKESKSSVSVQAKFKSDWDYLSSLYSTPRTLTPADSQIPKSTPANWNAIVSSDASEASTNSNDSTITPIPGTQSSPNIPAIVRAPGDGWQTLAAVVLVVAFTAIKRRTSAKAPRSN